MPFESRVRWLNLAKQYQVHLNQVNDWKNRLLTRDAGVFGAEQVEEHKADLKELHSMIGQQALEIDFFQSRSARPDS